MAIDYSNFDTDFADTIQRVNALSPTPDYSASADSIRQAGVGDGLFGMKPGQVNKQFDANYDKAVGGYDPFQYDSEGMDKLKATYAGVGDAYDVSGTVAAMDKTRGVNLLTGEQASNTAARKFSESQSPGSSNATGAAMIRAQSLLGFTQADTAAASDERQYADSAKQKALGQASDIATKLAQLEQDYTNSLASYNAGKAQFGLNYAGKKTDTALQASTVNTQSKLEMLKNQGALAEQARQANLAAALQQRNQDLSASQTATNQQMQAASEYLKQKGPSGSWMTNNSGQVVSGGADYNAYQEYQRSRGDAMGALGNIAY